MNSTLEILYQRKSVRIYSDQPVSAEDRDLILNASLRAPTAGNMMLYTIIEVEDQALKDRLAVTCDNQPFIARAQLLLLFAADYQRWYDYFIACGIKQHCQENGLPLRCPEEGDLLLACCDTLIAAHASVVAAESLGIGSCYIGDILENFEIHRELFGLPKYVLPITLVCFGYPTPEQAARKQTTRFDRQYVVHKDRYQHQTAEQLEQMMAPRSALFAAGKRPDGIDNLGQFHYRRKFISDFSVEMNRSVRAMLASWTAPEPGLFG